MSDYVGLAAAAILGLLVPSCAGWLWARVKNEFQAGNASIHTELKEIKAEQQSMRGEHTLLRSDVNKHAEEIAYLKGADSQRSQTATAALEAARLLLQHLITKEEGTTQIPNPHTAEGGFR